MKRLACAVLPILASGAACAAESESLKFSAYFDAYYGGNFNDPPPQLAPANGSIPPSQNGTYRIFDLYHNQFSLNDAQLSLRKEGNVAFRVDLDFGEMTDVTHTSREGVVDQVSKQVSQALVSYTPKEVPGLTFRFGKMYTFMALETTRAVDNWNYSRSALFTVGLPAWHVGAMANYAILPEKLSIGLHVYNGWNALTDNNSAKTIGLQAGWTPEKEFTLYYNLITGPEQDLDNSDRKTAQDLNFSWSASSVISAAADLLAGRSINDVLPGGARGDASWEAVTVAAKFVIHPRYFLSPRLESYWDHQGLTTGTAQVIHSATLTNSFALGEGLETRVEGRWDHSNQSVFLTSGGTSSDQVTLVLGVLYSL